MPIKISQYLGLESKKNKLTFVDFPYQLFQYFLLKGINYIYTKEYTKSRRNPQRKSSF